MTNCIITDRPAGECPCGHDDAAVGVAVCTMEQTTQAWRQQRTPRFGNDLPPRHDNYPRSCTFTLRRIGGGSVSEAQAYAAQSNARRLRQARMRRYGYGW